MNKLFLSKLLLWLFPLFFSTRLIEARTWSCSDGFQSRNEFRCIETKLWGQRCIDNNRVCDGHPDCEDQSDEWGYLCDHICLQRDNPWDPWEKGFSCNIYGILFFNGTGLDKFNQTSNNNSSHNGTYNGNRINSLHNRSHTVYHKSQVVNKEHQNDPTTSPLNYDWEWTTDVPNDHRCLPFNAYCNSQRDCWSSVAEGTAVDETNCFCEQNEKCKSAGNPADYWWIQILAATFISVILLFCCICVAIQWKNYRIALQSRRRETQQRRMMEVMSRRIAPANGQLNRGLCLDPTEFQARVNHEGATAAAPPSYSHATRFPKPADRDLPPPYLPEWITAYPAQTAPPRNATIGPIPYFVSNATYAPRLPSENAPAYSVTNTPANAPAAANSPGATVSPTANAASTTAQTQDRVQMAASFLSVQ